MKQTNAVKTGLDAGDALFGASAETGAPALIEIAPIVTSCAYKLLEDEVDDLQTANERLEAQVADLEESTVTKTEFNTFVDQLEEKLF